jgi:RNA polymerase sigma factor (sigma-70 family)
MAARPLTRVLQPLRRAVLLRNADLTDRQLLECFAAGRDDAACAALVRRHGPMVWGGCRRVLGRLHDAEDAFQATFLVLVRKAGSVRAGDLLGNWLYGVAYRTALKAKTAAARRRAREKQVHDMPEPVARPEQAGPEVQPVLDRELARLPAKYRAVVVLCDLEGKSRKDVARHLGCPEGTVASRLARARARLAKRLARHGFVLSGAAVAGTLSQASASAEVPASLLVSTVEAARLFAAGQAAAAGVISVRVAALTEGVLRAMFLTKLKTAAAVVLTAGVLVTATSLLVIPTRVASAAGGQVAPSQRPEPPPAEKAPRIQVRIAKPEGMKVWVLTPRPLGEGSPIEVPGRLNLEAGQVVRLKLAEIPNRPLSEWYPTVEIPKADATTAAFLNSSAVPLEFTDADFDQVAAGNVIVKVVYLAHRKEGQSPTGPAGTIVSYESPGQDVIAEAGRRGAILAIVRMGNLDRGNPPPGKAPPTGGTPRRKGSAQTKDGGEPAVQREEVLRLLAEKATALAEMQEANEALKQQLRAAKLEIDSLREALLLKEQEFQKLKNKVKDTGGR